MFDNAGSVFDVTHAISLIGKYTENIDSDNFDAS